jgi:tetratricopeptide (TPR) repeat protein
MSKLYKNQGKLKLALQFYNEALIIYERLFGKESLKCAKTLNSIGMVYRDQKNLNKAL